MQHRLCGRYPSTGKTFEAIISSGVVLWSLDVDLDQLLLLTCSVECFLLTVLLESRVRILAMLTTATACVFFIVGLGWFFITNRPVILWINSFAHDRPTWLFLIAAFGLTIYLLRNFPPAGAEKSRPS
jgi:hypothetical protein